MWKQLTWNYWSSNVKKKSFAVSKDATQRPHRWDGIDWETSQKTTAQNSQDAAEQGAALGLATSKPEIKRSQSQHEPGSPDVRKQDMGHPCRVSPTFTYGLSKTGSSHGNLWSTMTKNKSQAPGEPQIRKCQAFEGNQPSESGLRFNKKKWQPRNKGIY